MAVPDRAEIQSHLMAILQMPAFNVFSLLFIPFVMRQNKYFN